MDTDLFLQRLRELPIEDGRTYIQEHIAELSDHKAVGELLADEALRVLYAPFLSLKIAELLIFYGELTEDMYSHALGLKAKGDALQQIGHYQAAMEALDAAGEEFLRLEDEGNWARSRISWIMAAAWLGNVDEALQQAAQARSVFLQLSEYYWVAVIDNNTGMIYENIGKYQDALHLYEDMLAIFPAIKDQDEIFIKRSIAITEVNQARLLTWLGKFDQAYQLQLKAQACFNTLGEKGLVIRVEINLADLDYTLGYYGSALRRYYQVLDDLMQHDNNVPLHALRLAELQLCMANCLVKLNRTQEACILSEEATRTYRECGISLYTAKALRDHATVLIASGRLKDALTVLDEAWNLFNNGGFAPLAFLTRLQQAELLLEMDSISTAYDMAYLVKSYCDMQGLLAYSVRASLVIVGVLIKDVQSPQKKDRRNTILDEAVGLSKQMIVQANQQNLQEELYKSYYLLGQIYALQGNDTKAARQYRSAINQIEHILNNLVYDLSPSFLHTTWKVYEDMIALCLKQAQSGRAFSYLERARSLTLRQYLNKSKLAVDNLSIVVLRTQIELKDWQEKHRKSSVLLANMDASVSSTLDKEIIERELKRCEAKLSELFERLHLHQVDVDVVDHRPLSRKKIKTKERLLNGQEIDPEQLQQHLSPDQLLLTYYLHKDKLIIFAMNSEGIVTYENPNGVMELEYLLPLLHAHLQPEGWANQQRPPRQVIRRLLNKLYTLLVAPAASLLPPLSGYLTIVPYGPLHKLPFHALYDGAHFLIENFQVNYLPASSLLAHLSSDRGGSDNRSVQAEAAIKPPIVLGYSGHGNLRRVQDEAEVIAEMLKGHCYLEGEATIAHLIEEAPGSPVIHLATHGKSRLDAPNFSYVRLADGQLNAIDAFSLDLKRCELVTLSGCETGLALSSGGDEQLGLGRAFLAAGATSLVMSLWPVEDNATNELMKLFYQYLLQGESKAQALRTAQCSLLHQEEPDYTHPYFWAAFRLVGHIGPLKNQRVHDVLPISATQHLKTTPFIVEMIE